MRLGYLGRVIVILLWSAVTPVSTVANAAAPLKIPPIAQQTSAWCWLAALEMVFKYYHIPAINPINYQCGMAAAIFGGPCVVNCALCTVGSGPINTIQAVMTRYPPFARNYTRVAGPDLTSNVSYSELSTNDVKVEIDAGRPIIAGISPHSRLLPPGLSEHAIVIVGYTERNGNLYLTLNDPFPYSAVGIGDPYTAVGGVMLSPGRYRISYDSMVNDLAWGNTISGIDTQ